jgi:hypothetical protein
MSMRRAARTLRVACPPIRRLPVSRLRPIFGAAVLAAASVLVSCAAGDAPDATSGSEPGSAAGDSGAPGEAAAERPTGTTVPLEPEDPPGPAEIGANELGEIPVLMIHRVIEEPGPYDLSPEEFRRQLEMLYERRYYPVRAVDLVDGRLDAPAGYSPVVLTFDDSSPSQVRYLEDGRLDPDSALGILHAFSGERRAFPTAGSFYVIANPFGATGDAAAERLRYLASVGFELGNHTLGHVNLRNVSPDIARRELALGAQQIRDAVPGSEVRTLALPYGVWPADRDLVFAGEHDGIPYAHDGVLMVGGGPARSPFDVEFDPHAIPRITPGLDYHPDDPPDFRSGYWLWVLDEHPERRYVSDGDPDTISFPAELAYRLDPAYASRANPY